MKGLQKIKDELLAAGWEYKGSCSTCSTKSYKFQKGKYIIKVTGKFARLLHKNQTVKNGHSENITELTQYVERETEVLN